MAGLLLAAVSLVLLIVVARVHAGPVHRGEVAFDDRVNRALRRHPGQIDVWKAITTLGAPTTWRVLAGLAAVALWLRRRLRQAVLLVVAMAGAAAVSGVVKAIVDRPRPTVPYPIAQASGGSFPSGHALTSATALGLLVLLAGSCLSGRARALLIAGAAIVGIAVGASRVALGVHYPSDVLGGWLLAGCLVYAVTRAGFASPTWRSGSARRGRTPRG